MRELPKAPVRRLRGAILAWLAMTASPLGWAEDSCALPSEVHASIDQFLVARSKFAFTGTLLLEHSDQRQFVAATSQPGEMITLRRMNSALAKAPTSFPVTSPVVTTDACDIGENYRVAVEPGPTVAGKTTSRLTIRPRDTLRFGYVMDLDRATGLPLRVATATPDGQMLERYEFATIEVRPLPQDTADRVASGDDSPAPTAMFSLSALPPGFSLAPESGLTTQLVVTDGLASASVFLEPLPDGLGAGEGTVQSGSTVTYTRGINAVDAAYLVTVIGEVPVTTARLLASAVRMPAAR